MEQPESSTRAGVDRRDAVSEHRRMDDRINALEKNVAVLATEMSALRLNCATKEDIAALRSELRSDMASLASRVQEQITHLMKWMITWVTTVIMVTCAAVYFIARNVH